MSDKDVETLIWLARLGWLEQLRPNSVSPIDSSWWNSPRSLTWIQLYKRDADILQCLLLIWNDDFKQLCTYTRLSLQWLMRASFSLPFARFITPLVLNVETTNEKNYNLIVRKKHSPQHRLRMKPYPTQLRSKLFPDQGRKANLSKSPDCIAPKTRFPSW